jgi:hypothetical protein
VWKGGEEKTGFYWGKLREKDPLEDPVADRKIILKWILETWDGARTG